MKFISTAIAITSISLLAACTPAPENQQEDSIIQVVKLAKVSAVTTTNTMTFPAEVAAVKTIDLTFQVAGRLEQENLLTGHRMEKGALLAAIDAAPFERKVKEQQARLNQAKRELQRLNAISEQGLATQSQLDNAQTEFELAEIALSNAQQDLSYTKLSAPFNAQVSQRLVENNSYVKAGDVIARIQDVSKVYFNVNVAERLFTLYEGSDLVRATAEIVNGKRHSFDIEYVEHSTQPDPVTQTYKMVFAMDASNEINLTPGARGVVQVTLDDHKASPGLIVPFTALIGSEETGFHVWRFQPDSKTVEQVAVKVLKVTDKQALVLGRLKVNEQLVAAGAAKMRTGLQVKPYLAEQ